MGTEINQDQKQDVRFHSNPVCKVRCHFFLNHHIDEMADRMNDIVPVHPQRIILAKEIEREQQIDVVIFEGVVTRVICPLLEGANCSSPKNKGKPCYLKA